MRIDPLALGCAPVHLKRCRRGQKGCFGSRPWESNITGTYNVRLVCETCRHTTMCRAILDENFLDWSPCSDRATTVHLGSGSERSYYVERHKFIKEIFDAFVPGHDRGRTVEKNVLFPEKTYAEISYYVSDDGISVFVRECVMQRCSFGVTLPADPPGKKIRAIKIRWTQKEWESVQLAAKSIGYPVTVFIRMCVQDFLDAPIVPVPVPCSNVELFG